MSVLKSMLLGGQGIARTDSMLAGLTLETALAPVDSLPYTIYGLLWHIELSQNLLLSAIMEEQDEVQFPPLEEQWPQGEPTQGEWEDLISQLRAGIYEASELAANPQDLSERDREVLEDIAAHNAYHWGQVVVMRRLLGNWPLEESGMSA